MSETTFPRPFLRAFLPLETLSGGLAVIMISALLLAQIIGQVWPPIASAQWVAAFAAVVLAVLRLGEVKQVARLFLFGAFATAGAVAVLHPSAMPDLYRALFQGTAFSSFLTSLGLIRGPVRRSPMIQAAATRLFAFPLGQRIPAMVFGAQALSVLFNIGTIGMMSDIATDHARRAGREGTETASVTLAALRGTILMTIWNPLGVGFAIVTAAIAPLDPVIFLGIALAATLVVTVGSILIFHHVGDAGPVTQTPRKPQGMVALISVLVAVTALIFLTLGLHRLFDISFLVAACLVMPLLAVFWPLLERDARAPHRERPLAALGACTATMANEATMFLSAAVIGAGASMLLNHLGIGQTLENGTLPMLAIILGCLVLIPLVGALMVPHSIAMVLAAQLFGAGPIGHDHPYSLALGLCFAWAIAISASPISAMSIMAARHLNVPATQVPFHLNRSFTLFCLSLAVALVSCVYLLE